MSARLQFNCIDIVHYNMSTFVPYEHWNHNRKLVVAFFKKAGGTRPNCDDDKEAKGLLCDMLSNFGFF